MNINVVTPVVSGESIQNIDLYEGTISNLNSALASINSKADVINVWGNQRPFIVPQELIDAGTSFNNDFDISLSTPLDIIKTMFSSK